MAEFKPRLSKPEAGNPYYNRKDNGGTNPCIKGKPTDSGCNVLSNCVGYAIGRFNEIANPGYCKYLRSTNAENFMQVRGNLEYGITPKLGAIIVWQKGATLSGSDGAGHVAVVEQINADGSIVTSESGYGGSAFWTSTRKKGNGNWGAGYGYKFLGFIYQPESIAVPVPEKKDDPELTAFIKEVQSVIGAQVDGVAGQETITKTPTLSQWRNRKHPVVAVVQRRLLALGYDLGKYGADGVYGPATAKAVKAYQRLNGCVDDGVITGGNRTWSKLLDIC